MSRNSKNRKYGYYNENQVDGQHSKPDTMEEITNEWEDRSEEVNYRTESKTERKCKKS